jgi:hypothetical protein
MWVIVTTIAVTVKVGRMGGSGCLEDGVGVGVGVENDEDDVLILVFACGLRDVGFGCRVVLLRSRHLLFIPQPDLSNSCMIGVNIPCIVVIRPTNTNTNIEILLLLSTPRRNQLFHLPQQTDLALNSIMFGNNTSNAITFLTWLAGEDWVS